MSCREVPRLTALDLTQFSVLIVDDNPNNLFTLEALLTERLGVEVIQATSGMTALAVLLERSVDVIILDVQMPGLDGFETAKMIKQRKRDANVPIIFLTAAAKREEDIEEGFDLGAVDYLFKPVDERQLINKLNGYFRAIDQERKKQRELEANLSATSHELADSEALNERILSAVPQGLVVVQSDHIVLVNDGFRRMFEGLFATERGRPVSEILERLELPVSLQERIARREAFSRHEVEIQQVGAGALKLVIQVDGIPFDDKILVVVNNVTEQKIIEQQLAKSMEEAQAASRAKSQFLANMSHEFRTPLNGILGLAELINTQPLEPGQTQHLQLLQRSGERLLRLVNDVLDMSQVEAGAVRLRQERFDLAALLHDLIDLHGHPARSKGLELRLESTFHQQTWLRADSDRVRQVLVNLLGNAIKFTERGQVTLRCRRLESSVDTMRIRFEVEDTGIGIAQERSDHLFERFSQIDNSNTRVFGGTGLGLAISKEICELMGGSIGHQNREEGGCLFWVEIPFQASDLESTPPAPQLVHLPKVESVHGLHILVVEDDPVNQVVVQAMVENIGCHCTVLSDGAQAVASIQEDVYDLVLMDLHMPVLDGLHATEEIRVWEQANGRSPCPIIALTANVMPGTRADCLSAGMDDYLAKPVSQGELHQLIEDLMGKENDQTQSAPVHSEPEGGGLSQEHIAYQRETLGHVFTTLITTYLEHTSRLLSELDEAVSEENPEQIWSLAHRLKSSSAQVGAMGLSDMAKTIEHAGREGRFDIHQEVQKMHLAYGSLEPKLKVLAETA